MEATVDANIGEPFTLFHKLQAKKRVEDLIQSAADEGATILLDGRGIKVRTRVV